MPNSDRIQTPATHTTISTDDAREILATLRALVARVEVLPGASDYVGDDGSTPDLIATVARVITRQPCTLVALGEITGARRNRLSGAIVKLQEQGRVVNLGNGSRAVWSIPAHH